jgi:hypothetical protein
MGMSLAGALLHRPVDMASHPLALVLPCSWLQELRRPLMTKVTSFPFFISLHLAMRWHPVPSRFLLRPQLLTRFQALPSG